MAHKSNHEFLSRELVLNLPGYSKFCGLGLPALDAPATVLAPADHSASNWFRKFTQRVEAAIGDRAYLPIYRMGDGEYSVLVGHQLGLVAGLRKLAGRILRRRPAHRSGDPVYGFEEYTSKELRVVRSLLLEHIRKISSTGVLAMALHPKNPGFARFIDPVLTEMDNAGILLNKSNYAPFYFVYALLCGLGRHQLFKDRQVLVVTGDTAGKYEGLRKGFAGLEARGVEFLACHSSKSMFDALDINKVLRQPDIVLVGAGIGSANVLNQLAPLKAPCIDAGFCLTVIGRPETTRRAYAAPDDEYDQCTLSHISPSVQ